MRVERRCTMGFIEDMAAIQGEYHIRCYHCDDWKPGFEFHLDRRDDAEIRGWRQGVCKECKRKYHKEYTKKKRAWDKWDRERDYWARFNMKPPTPEPERPQPMRWETVDPYHIFVRKYRTDVKEE
jgi:hypothetical protein